MADNNTHLSDEELFAEFQKYGEAIALPIKAKNRPILIKKLNHLRVRHRLNVNDDASPASGRNASLKPATIRRGSPATTATASSPRTRSMRSEGQSSSAAVPTQPKTYRGFGNRQNLDTLSSDESDTEPMASVRVPSPSGRSVPEKRPFSDNVLRTLRRRTSDRMSRIRGPNNVTESEGENFNHVGPEDKEGPSTSQSHLYPDLSKYLPSRFGHNDEHFESSDEDVNIGTPKMRNQSSFLSDYDTLPSPNSSLGHNVSGSSSDLDHSTTSLLRYRVAPTGRYMNGPGYPQRVQQYKSRFSELLPFILILIAMVFFLVLSVMYAVIHKDFFFSWLPSSSNIAAGDHFLICKDKIPVAGCCTSEEIEKSVSFTKEVFSQLSAKKGEVLCELTRPGEDVLRALEVKRRIRLASISETQTDRLYVCVMEHLLANPHWNILTLREDNTVAKNVMEIHHLESEVARMNLWCRIRRSFTQVLYGIFLASCGLSSVVLLVYYMKYRLKQREQQQREVYALVEKIIDIIQSHYLEQQKGEDSETPYLAVQHVRDQLIPPAHRRQLQSTWDKSLEFIAANESRIRIETRIISGEEFEVWRWLQPSFNNGKVWQGQAFGEKENPSHADYSPTPCLKIRSMFDNTMECEDGWEDSVVDAVLEKCGNINSIVHVFVDSESREGCVYMKCSNCQAAGLARAALNGWWFDGRLVTVKHLKIERYHKRWPEARNAVKPLRPSTNEMNSLSQPFYKSSLERT